MGNEVYSSRSPDLSSAGSSNRLAEVAQEQGDREDREEAERMDAWLQSLRDDDLD